MIQRTAKQAAIAHYGADYQLIKTIEEMAELTHVIARRCLNKDWQAEAFYEELADVYAMLDQVKIIFATENNVSLHTINHTLECQQNIKMNRTLSRMQEEWAQTERGCDSE